LSTPTVPLHIVVPTPAHSSAAPILSYAHDVPLPAGTLVRVPLGAREVLGIAWDEPQGTESDLPQLRRVGAVLEGLAPLPTPWRRLVAFAARYYQRSLGEVALSALPPSLRELTADQLTRRLRRMPQGTPAPDAGAATVQTGTSKMVVLSTDQQSAAAEIDAHPGPFLLFGSTGSGKTEVYLHAVQAALTRDPVAQALVLVPEINLTPQLEARFRERFETLWGASAIVSLHSAMTPAQRLKSWLAAHTGQARIVLGTRMAILASLPRLALIVVDEEHDASYKQQEGARYSARDLAVWRARDVGAKVILGSATPSLESWHASDPAAPRYQRLHMPARIGAGELPRLRLIDMSQQPRKAVFAPPLIAAITERVQRGEQCLVLLNRRGFAPVLHCGACGWKSDCPHCSATQVFHKSDRTLRCHHCGFASPVPRACPDCGNPDILTMGRGTEQLEEQLAQLLRNVITPERRAARVARIDADTTRARGALKAQLAQMHAGDVDVLVGTQMVAKGHDFRRVTLVAAVQPDGALFSSDFRAPERLFALLMQAGGRAGRDAQYMKAQQSAPELWVQTWHPEHPLFAALRGHDYPAFAARQLAEREAAGMPPFSHQALLRADARTQEAAQDFLRAASEAARTAQLPGMDQVFLYPPVPLAVQRVANVERAQMLLESPHRGALQHLLAAWQPLLHAERTRHRAVVRWLIDVDPQAI